MKRTQETLLKQKTVLPGRNLVNSVSGVRQTRQSPDFEQIGASESGSRISPFLWVNKPH
ncbi:hypothetical protein H1230_28350 [Paenibacillus sp. 19GGS1-52]|uniref:hypothetical protein n=1 Tax=Paenibacillus sp. 19GGS1-52 TaxID=2758563 RepID=UPI001EFA5EE6|nr:hypothetical protein [Paenibacillus sp. 19GGS1-52]ULO06827.1 hypothetical protein H1230_28350 [Paenibacillus sp. 19GGS1-52]